MRRTLIVVDTQPTFCEGGGLPVEGGNAVAERIGAYIARNASRYDEIVASEDWHIAPGEHWAPEGTAPDFDTMWPRHGAAGEQEANLHPAMLAALDAAGPLPQQFSALVRKGMYAAAFSAFEGVVVDDPDELVPTGPLLAAWLRDHDVTSVDVCGIATDYCVAATARDAAREGFTTRVLVDLCAGVAPETTETAVAAMAAEGIEVTMTEDVEG